MKKVLLLMTLFLTLGLSALAAEYTFKMADLYGSSTITLPAKTTWGDFDITLDKGTNSNAPAFNKAGDARLYANNIMTISSAAANITKISFTISSNGKAQCAEINVSTGEMTQSGSPDYVCDWNGDANEITFTVGDNKFGTSTSKTTGQFYFTSVTITTSDAGVAVLAPVFSVGSGNVMPGTEVEITCGTEGASIYYTTDGTEPTAESTLYDGAITIDEAMTLKAIAIKGADHSSITTATYTIIETVNTLAKAKTYGKGETLVYNGDLTIVYKNGANCYVYDGVEYALIYGTVNGEAGDVIKAGWEATVDIYGGLFELKPVAGTITIEGTATIPAPTEITAANIADIFVAANASAYAVMKSVSIENATPADKSNFNVKVGETEVIFRNNFTLASVEPGEYDVTGFIAVYNTDMQLYPVSYTLIQAYATVAEPTFNPEAGAVDLGTEVEITCETEGAAIYYTTDGTDPTAESTLYEGAITIDEEMTIKAIAIKGEAKSAVVTAEYTIKSADEPSYTEFVMSEVYPKAMDVTNTQWGDFYLTFYKGTNTSAPHYYTSGYDLRTYAKNYFTITSPKYKIVKMVFEISTQGKKRQAPITASVGEIETQAVGDETVTWVGASQEITLTVGDKANYGSEGNSAAGQFCFTKVTIYYEDVALQAPVFSIAGGAYDPGTEVEITCGTEGAEIYYTTDGTEPTEESTKYTGPIAIDKNMTISTIAIKGADKSIVFSASYSVVYTVSTLAEVKKLAKDDTFFYTGDLTYIYNKSAYTYVYDGTDYTLIYTSTIKANPGDVIKGGWTGTVDIFYNNFQLKPVNGTVYKIDGTAEMPEPIEINADNASQILTVENQNNYYVIRSIEFTAATPTSTLTNFSGKVGEKTVSCLNRFSLPQYAAGTYDVTGFINVSNNTVRFCPIEYKEPQTSAIEGIEADSDADATYYNLNGMRIDNPAAGQVVIRVQDGKAAKVRF